MELVWDEHKRQTNIEKHSMDFADVFEFEWETAIIKPSYAKRFKAVGRFRGSIAVIVYASLGIGTISIISFRPASKKERRLL